MCNICSAKVIDRYWMMIFEGVFGFTCRMAVAAVEEKLWRKES